MFLSPLAVAAPAYTEELGEDYELSCTLNSLFVPVGIAALTAGLLILT